MRRTHYTTALALVFAFSLWGCRGNRSKEPPVHLQPNMDNVQYQQAQEGNTHFKDGRAMRPQVPGTVARGELKTDKAMHRGKGEDGKHLAKMPVAIDRALLSRGKERFDIYCTPCHGAAGSGKGIVVKRGMLPPPDFAEKRVKEMPVGEIFDVISNGVRNMPSYAAQIPAVDRWAIVAYVRALQTARSAKLKDVPEDVAGTKGWSK